MSEVIGQARLQATLRAASSSLAGPGLAGAARQAEAAMVQAVRARTPRRTGRLAGSVRPAPATGVTSGRVVSVASDLAYAAPREYGVPARRGQRGGHNVRAARMFATGAAVARPVAVAATTDAVAAIMARVRGA